MTILIKNATIVTMGSEGVIYDGLLVVNGTRIVSLQSQNKNISDLENNADEIIDAAGKIVMPGLIDSHFHTCQHLMRGMGAAIARRGTRYPFGRTILFLLNLSYLLKMSI